MSSRARARGIDDRGVLWLACGLALCAGWYIAFFQLGSAIDDQHDRNDQLRAIIRANQTALAQRPQLEHAAHRADDALHDLDLQADHATTVARFIRESARIAALHHARLDQIDERHAEAAETPATLRSASDPTFESIPLDVTLSGSYRDLLGTVRDLAEAPVAMRIEIAAIERSATTDQPTPADALTARLHVAVMRLADAPPITSGAPAIPNPKETPHARSL